MMDELRRRTLGKVTRRLLPLMLLCYVAAYLDRINVGFAALQIQRDLGFSDAVYGLGAGLFFLGYFLFEIPSNLILERVGARIWIARIMITWGVLSSAMMFARSVPVFYGLRFLLGAAEAGFFPGMILYLTYWFPARDRARAVSHFMTASTLAWIVGAPVSGALLTLDGRGGLAGWQWLFLLEGLPSIALGIVVLAVMVDRPAKASWLSDDEREWLDRELRSERATEAVRPPLRTVVSDPKIWLVTVLYLLLSLGGYGYSLWLPPVVQAVSHGTSLSTGFLSAIPYVVTAAAMIAIGTHSDRVGERRWHVALPAFGAALGLASLAWPHGRVPAIAFLSLSAAGLFGCLGPFWALATEHLSRRTAAGGIAFINSVGNLGGILGPWLVGILKGGRGDYAAGFLCLAGALLAAGTIALALSRRERIDAPPSEPATADQFRDLPLPASRSPSV